LFFVFSNNILSRLSALGCPSPPAVENATITGRNATHALLECNEGFAFFYGEGIAFREVETACSKQIWSEVPLCVGKNYCRE